METFVTKTEPNPAEQSQDVEKTDSAENFQKFIYELFDKNGVLNDLRAYLRGHIVDVLKSAQSGDLTACQKHITQRMDSTFQALNMLVTEYLLCLDFKYSLSVFVSEIPLANMKFGLAKTLMDLSPDGEVSGLRFEENDVWSILNCLGIKCDCEHASKIGAMYRTQTKMPLLMCILKNVEFGPEKPHSVSSHDGSSSTSSKSSNTDKQFSPHEQCKHLTFCEDCRKSYKRLKDRYRKQKKHYMKTAQFNALNVDSLMKNIDVLERSLIDEMFEHLKTVYEAEIDTFKMEHRGKIKRSLASHVLHFQRMRSELEESFKAREAVLEANVVQKKRFLWGLAQALRAQHSQMSKAMQTVKKQTALLADQEKNFKIQRTEAEESLNKHGNEMKQQIAEELIILEHHLESMKTERESINKERLRLDEVQSNTKVTDSDIKNYLETHYHLLKDELGMLKMYVENATFQPKTTVERSTITDDDKEVMNNGTARGLAREEVTPNQVVNVLKKQKNVNFSQYKSEGDSRDSCSGSSSFEDLCRLHENNERLRQFARQTQMSRLSSQIADLRPRTATETPRLAHSIRDSTDDFGWRKGAGEERSILASTRILVPGDTLPFVGVIAERRADSRRHLLNRWRALRRRVSPLAPDLVSRSVAVDEPENVEGCMHNPPSEPTRSEEENHHHPTRANLRLKTPPAMSSQKTREKSPRSVLKEAKEKLKTVTRASASRDKSPSAMLREAKMRLRKLEIEAEAVERSYKDFRRRHDLRNPDRVDDRQSVSHPVSRIETRHKDVTPGQPKSDVQTTNSLNFDLGKYLKKYNLNLNMGQERFANNNAAAVLKNPVSDAYSEINRNIEPIPKNDYLEKPLLEFRKLYYTKPVHIEVSGQMSLDFQEPLNPPNLSTGSEVLKEKCPETRNEKNKRQELEILKQNISNIYDLHDEPTKETVETKKESGGIDIANNLLTVEVENVNVVSDLKVTSSQTDMIMVVKGSVDTKDLIEYNESQEYVPPMMTINIISEVTEEVDEISKEISSEKPTLDLRKRINQSSSPERLAYSPSKAAKDYYEASGDKEFPLDDELEIRVDPDSEIQLDARNQVSETEPPDEYPDDISYDVDSYAPISFLKTSDDNFWDSQ